MTKTKTTTHTVNGMTITTGATLADSVDSVSMRVRTARPVKDGCCVICEEDIAGAGLKQAILLANDENSGHFEIAHSLCLPIPHYNGTCTKQLPHHVDVPAANLSI